MSSFLHDDFLLDTVTAQRLYHQFAAKLPIIDYHCHLVPKIIAENQNFPNISRLWLGEDSNKWRAMRTMGIDEKFITGSASDREKFQQWARIVPYTVRNPLYHWTHMELKKPFGVHELLSDKNADRIYEHCNELLQQDSFRPRSLLSAYNIELIGTTDDPTDDLMFHKEIASSGFTTKVVPSFRPDKALQLGGDGFREYLAKLSAASGIEIVGLDSLLEALEDRINYFHSNGCRIADHGLAQVPGECSTTDINAIFQEVLHGDDRRVTAAVAEAFAHQVLLHLCQCYQARGWVQQFHLGAIRNTNSRMMAYFGPDAGCDSIGDFRHALNLSKFLNRLDSSCSLAKTIIYNLNPADNAVFAAMIGNFGESGIKGKIQFGSAWWFSDQLEGMKNQINMLSNLGLISCFIGMLTDSRNVLSYSRHEYFRRLVCQMFGRDIERGLLPNDLDWTGKIIADICYYNARNYFPFQDSQVHLINEAEDVVG